MRPDHAGRAFRVEFSNITGNEPQSGSRRPVGHGTPAEVAGDLLHVSPKPVQQPYPPIWIGGTSDAALHRAARFAALWQPTPLPIAELVERQTALRQASDKIGRVPIPTRMSVRQLVQCELS